MGKVYLLFDSSAAAEYYLGTRRYRDVLEHMYAKQLDGKAFFYIPTFCIPEIFSVFAKLHYRKKKLPKDIFQDACDLFADHIRNRKVFYCYDLNRYHNLNLKWHGVFQIEHETDTEYQVLEIDAKKVSDSEVGDAHLVKFGTRSVGRYYLSGLDLLIIGMMIELNRTVGERVYLVTRDKRLAKVCENIQVKPFGSHGNRPLKVLNLLSADCFDKVKRILT